MTLPTEKRSPSLSFDTAKLMVYGPAGIGKTTLAATLDPDHTLLMATEPGYGGLEAYVEDVRTWDDFLTLGRSLANDEHRFKIVAVDTVDELYTLCQEYVQQREGITHPSDLEYGKGWAFLREEWRLRVARLCSLGLGVVFISHAKDVEIEERVGKVLKTVPSFGGAGGDWVQGFVDYIFLARAEGDDDNRVLRTVPSREWIAKARGVEIEDPLPLNAVALKAAIVKANKALKPAEEVAA